MLFPASLRKRISAFAVNAVVPAILVSINPASAIAIVFLNIFFSPPSLDGAIIADSKRRNYHESVKDCKAQKKMMKSG